MIDFLDSISIRAVAEVGYTFSFLDSSFTIVTNQPEAMIYFQKMYPNFSLQAPEERDAEKDEPGAYYVINEPRFLKKPFIWADGRIYPCPESLMLPWYAHSVITNSIMARITSHLIFHAAAVSWLGEGVIILGASCQGKSTLTMELINRGFQFFSDDLTCLHRKNRLISPFPRAFSLRQSAGRLFTGFDSLAVEPGRKKIFMRLSDVPQIKLADPCSPRFLFCLSPQEEFKHKAKNQEDNKSLYLVLDRFEDEMIRDFEAMSEVKECEKLEGEFLPVIKLISRRGSFLLPRLERICYKHQVAILNIAKNEKRVIDYSQEPHLSKISKPTAMRGLLRGFRGGWTSSVIQEADGGIASLLFELSQIIEKVDCYRLVPGKLGQMADLICDLVNGG